MAKRGGSLAEKMLALTDDRTTTVTPSFMEVLAPLMSIMFFSGMSEDIAGKKGEVVEGELPSPSGIHRPGTMSSFMPDNAWLGKNAPKFDPSMMTPEMIVKILSILGGMGGGRMGGGKFF